MSEELVELNQDMVLMSKIANDEQTVKEIKMLSSNKVQDQLKVFLIAQARNELKRVVKLIKFLDRLEESFINKADEAIEEDTLTLRQYNEVITLITSLISRSNDIISKVIKDDSLSIINTTIYSDAAGSGVSTSIVSQLKDSQSRERVRSVINTILVRSQEYVPDEDIIKVEGDE